MRAHAKRLRAVLTHTNGGTIHATGWEDGGLFYTLYPGERRKKSDAKKREARIAKAEADT